jgi:hypothetical protein
VISNMESGRATAARTAQAFPTGNLSMVAFILVFRSATPHHGLVSGIICGYLASLLNLLAVQMLTERRHGGGGESARLGNTRRGRRRGRRRWPSATRGRRHGETNGRRPSPRPAGIRPTCQSAARSAPNRSIAAAAWIRRGNGGKGEGIGIRSYPLPHVPLRSLSDLLFPQEQDPRLLAQPGVFELDAESLKTRLDQPSSARHRLGVLPLSSSSENAHRLPWATSTCSAAGCSLPRGVSTASSSWGKSDGQNRGSRMAGTEIR